MIPSTKTPALYLLSGLGADKTALDFIDLSGYKRTHLEWIPPNENESIESYAKRLSQRIDTVQPILIGVSFGGMMAIEISRQIDTALVIIISSARGRNEIPWILRFIGKLRLHVLVPVSLLMRTSPLTYWFFGAKTLQTKTFLTAMMKTTDPVFMKWAVDKILGWKNETIPKNLVTIHGDNDRILPGHNPDFEIKGGGHLMIVNNHKEVTSIVRQVLSKFS